MNSNSPLLSYWYCQLLIALGAAGFASTTAIVLQLIIDGQASALVSGDGPQILVLANLIALFSLPGIVLWLIATRVSSRRRAPHFAFWTPQLLMCLYTAFALWDVLRRQTSDAGGSLAMLCLVCLLAASGGAYVALLVLERQTDRRIAS